MKCICGFEEPKEWEETVPVYYQSGKRKGELKRNDVIVHSVDEKDRFIQIHVERDFEFVVKDESYYTTYFQSVSLYACPKCSTVRMEK